MPSKPAIKELSEQELAKHIGKNLLAKRTKGEVSAETVADTAEVARRSYSDWERGEQLPTLRSLLRLANYHGVHPSDLMRP